MIVIHFLFTIIDLDLFRNSFLFIKIISFLFWMLTLSRIIFIRLLISIKISFLNACQYLFLRILIISCYFSTRFLRFSTLSTYRFDLFFMLLLKLTSSIRICEFLASCVKGLDLIDIDFLLISLLLFLFFYFLLN